MPRQKRTSYQSLMGLAKEQKQIRNAQGKVVGLPVIETYPGHIKKARVHIKKTSHGIEFTTPTSMEQATFINWKEYHWKLISDIKKMTKEEWKEYVHKNTK